MTRFPLQTKDALYHTTLAIIVGLIGGVCAILLRQLIRLNQAIFFDFLLPHIAQPLLGSNLAIILIPAIGGILVAFIIRKSTPESAGQGIPEVIEAVNVYGSKIRGRVGTIKAVVSSITIGSGGSSGREGPIAQIGASIGSYIGQKLKVGERQTRLLVACGMASGISATFNAPLGGAIFTMEILLSEFDTISATSLILASVVGSAFAVYLPIPGLESFALGTKPAFDATGLAFNHPFELVFYLAMGLWLGILSVVWMQAFFRVEQFFDKLKINRILKPGLGGALTGILGIGFLNYGILGGGYEGINQSLAGQISIGLLIVLGIVKILATAFTVGSGGSGGVLAPSLYIGCMFGGAFGIVFNQLSPGIAPVPMTYALVGMGAFLAGTIKAPLTCMILIPEMVNDWLLLAPIMVACVSSYLVSSLFIKDSIDTLKLSQRGIPLDVDHILSEVRVKQIMMTKVDCISHKTKVSDLILKMRSIGHTGYPVTKEGALYGIITLGDLQGADLEDTADNICTKSLFTLKPMDSAQKAVRLLYEKDVGRLIVVDERDPKKILGIVSRSDIIKAYHQILRLKKNW